MAIYLALLDENPADRKQAERLLYRESSYRASLNDALYFETFGNEAAFFPFMEKYDLVFIDIHENRDGMMVAFDMIKKGCSYPIFLCSGDFNYRDKYSTDPRFSFDNIHYLDKPLKESDYRTAIDMALEFKNSHPQKIELRGETETLYVLPEEIIYILEKKGVLSFALTGDRYFRTFGRLNEFILSMPGDLRDFMQISKSTVINIREVVSVSGNSFRMSNGAITKFSIFAKPGILKYWKKRSAELQRDDDPPVTGVE